MEILVSLLLGIIIGNAITYYIVQKTQQKKTIREYETQIQILKEQLQQIRPKTENQEYSKTVEKSLTKAYSIQDIRKTHPRAYKPWTKAEDEKLKQHYTQGQTINDLAQEFQRKPGGIRSRLKKLGLH